jgi:hypothetical protein
MTYTIKIDTTSRQAQSILNMLKALSIDYDFLQIHEDTSEDFSEITTEQKRELESRYEYVLENPTVGKPWNEVKQNLLSK